MTDLANSRPRNVALSALYEGLTRPSPLAIGIAIGFNLLVFTTLLLVLTPAFIGRQHDTVLAERGTDYDAVVTARMLALQAATEAPPSVVVLGGSTTRASLLEADLVDGLRGKGLSQYRLLKLCTSRQSLWESLALAENFPAALSGVVVIGVGPALFTMGDEVLEDLALHPRLGIRSAQLDHEFSRRHLPVAPRTGLYVIDNAAFVLPRLDDLAYASLRGRRTPYIDSLYVTRPRAGARATEALVGNRANLVEARFRLYDSQWAKNLVLLERVVSTVRRREGMQIVLVETPMNPAFVGEHRLESLVARHRDRMKSFAQDQGLAYVELNRMAGLTPDDFFDWAHLDVPDAARRSAKTVIDVIGTLVGARPAEEGR